MKLYGSRPSPYTRRLRMLMAHLNYQFIEVDVYSDIDRAMLLAHNPTLKIPMIMDNEQAVLDSGLIFQYLVDKGDAKALSLAQQNMLMVIDGANDSFVQLFLLERSEIENSPSKLFFRLQNERITAALAYLETAARNKELLDWNYMSMSLYAMLDWIRFRSLYDLTPYPGLNAFLDSHAQRAEVIGTDPR